MHATLGGGIPCCDHHPAIGKLILAELAIEHQLVAASLRHLRCRGELVEKEDALTARGQELGRHPLGLIGRDSRRTRRSTESSCTARTSINCRFISEAACANDLGFADAAGAPDMRGHKLADQRMQRLKEC
jgi:hypothetical protein